MPCYHPLKAFPIGKTKNDKIDYKICSYDVDHLEVNRRSSGIVYTKCYDNYFSREAESIITDFVPIPCGNCIGCRLEYSRQWANRCMLELENHNESYFVTLTYDDLHIPLRDSFDSDGVLQTAPTLVKKDLQNFIKRLRKNTGQEIRFFSCGEYGSTTFRPHYHLIIFGLHLDDLVVYKRNFDGDILYNSPTIQKAWQNRGFCVVGEVTYQSCAYVSRYITKKLKGEQAHFYSDLNIEPEFTNMSRRPGIGRSYLDNHPNLWNYNYINLSTEDGGLKFTPPKYFERLFELDYPIESLHRSIKRQEFAKVNNLLKAENTSLPFLSYLETEEQRKLSAIKSLQRKEV